MEREYTEEEDRRFAEATRRAEDLLRAMGGGRAEDAAGNHVSSQLVIVPFPHPMRRPAQQPRTRHALDAAIEALERAQVDPDSKPTCSVCLDEIAGEAM